MTSGKVSDGFISTNMHYFAKPGDTNLDDVFRKTKNTGVTRFEYTVYTSKFPDFR